MQKKLTYKIQMTEIMEFKKTTKNDIPILCDIFNYYITNTTCTFYTNELTVDQFSQNLIFENSKYISYSIFVDSESVGFVSLTKHKAREAYDLTGEVSIYLNKSYIGRGIGSKAIEFIEKYAESNEFHTLIATVCGENLNSIKLFERNNYIKCSHFREVGKKFGRFLDVISLQKIL
jgi:L-amino acid N-acyltransferase YncA